MISPTERQILVPMMRTVAGSLSTTDKSSQTVLHLYLTSVVAVKTRLDVRDTEATSLSVIPTVTAVSASSILK